MGIRKIAGFLFWSAILGLAAAFLVVLIRPDLVQPDHTVVKVREQTVPAPTAKTSDSSWSGPVSYASAVETAAPAVVNIHTTKVVRERAHPFANDPFFQYFFGDRYSRQRKRLQTSLGSGVIISENGYVLTNHHVVAGADEIHVMLADGRNTKASVVGTDADTDLAILRVEIADLPTIVIGDSDRIRVGDVVLAIGNPFGVGQTVTQGIVSATGRNQLGINTFENFIQTDAAINPGNSGGALVNAYGELIGINSAIFSRSGGSQGIGFAIPVSLAKDIMTQIIEHGTVVRGWLGVEAQDLTPALAASFGLDNTRGVLIAGIWRNGPADRAGLQLGDIVTAINGQPVSNSRGAMYLIAKQRPGTAVTVTGVRQGEAFETSIQVVRRPSNTRAR
ncbi:MAG: Do family serine endopeptidase [Gammaproteobacteria bacterium]